MIEPVSMFKRSDRELSILGGTYKEICQDPSYRSLMGSGFRAAVALSNGAAKVRFITCLAEDEIEELTNTCSLLDISCRIILTTSTICFSYLHPLKKPEMYPLVDKSEMFRLPIIAAERVLYYGMAEAVTPVEAEWLVYDPQNLIRFEDTGSVATHLALIMNKKEASFFSSQDIDWPIESLGTEMLQTSKAEVIVIKNGAAGAWVFERNNVTHVPVFKTTNVWPIGSGDIFSAVFAWQWMLNNKTPTTAALLASKYTAGYCNDVALPLPAKPINFPALKFKTDDRKIYLAGPFFTHGERWLIQELKEILEDFGHDVFSPLHEVGIEGRPQAIAKADIAGINSCKAMLAVVSGLDAGTLFEIGYARAKGKKVVVFAENVSDEDLLMLRGTGCEITADLSTAIYTATW
ncbi:nucleoside 2-deoxyribosyltransferase [Mucilaginibacter sp. 21P]|uniref:PfkB family carbohydrate kinase n=1 Tax=Mucilaginibacter sp. 21P TaxID=2778902 RepID=UPI001C599119|nr:PfkB family carbohydrate kinase [Mucilaginibacter sp. 21P]QXV63621.1 nucleoside 2-deoxyribosyltransferase [Mucilaginibacter sp. 21P]